MVKVIIVVSGGVVQDVFTSRDAEVIVLDYDNLEDSDFDGRVEKKYDDFIKKQEHLTKRARIAEL